MNNSSRLGASELIILRKRTINGWIRMAKSLPRSLGESATIHSVKSVTRSPKCFNSEQDVMVVASGVLHHGLNDTWKSTLRLSPRGERRTKKGSEMKRAP